MGKGGTGGRSSQRKRLPDTQGRRTGANLTAKHSNARCDLVTEASPTEEPCEGKLHAGICAGGAGRPAFLPRHDLWRWNPRVLGDLLFHSATDALRALLADPRHLGAEPGITVTLDTWDDRLFFHPHLHCLVTGGGITSEGDWTDVPNPRCLVPVRPLMWEFRTRFCQGLTQAVQDETLSIDAFLRRYLQHIPPPRYRTVRHDGLYTSGKQAAYEHCRELLADPQPHAAPGAAPTESVPDTEAWVEAHTCPVCGQPLVVSALLPSMRTGRVIPRVRIGQVVAHAPPAAGGAHAP